MAQLMTWTSNWASVYANHAAIRTLVAFLHVGGLVAGGGLAIATDRTVVSAVQDDEWSRHALLDAVGASHRVVIFSIIVIVLSGVLMFAADLDTYGYSRLFWLKMAFFVTLLGNGVTLTRAERRALAGDARAWHILRRTAIASATLWFLTTLVGVALPNI